MASTGFIIAGAAVNVAGIYVDWTNPGNVTFDDSVFATASIEPFALGKDQTDVLKTSSHALDVPGDGNIDGVIVRVNWKTGPTVGLGQPVFYAELHDEDAETTISEEKQISISPSSTETNTSFGSSSDLWEMASNGYHMWPNEMNRIGVKFRIAIGTFSGKISFSVDAIWINIYYTAGTTVRIKGKVTGEGTSTLAGG